MKVTAIVSALFISMVAATPAANPGSEGIYPFDKRDITPEGLWKRDCPGSEVPNPLCPYGQFRCYHADGSSQCTKCGESC